MTATDAAGAEVSQERFHHHHFAPPSFTTTTLLRLDR